MELEFSGDVIEWRGPAPHHFVQVPEDGCAALDDLARAVTYGWGMVPVTVTLGETTWTTSLWPRGGGYVVPIKAEVRRRERVDLGDVVALAIVVDV